MVSGQTLLVVSAMKMETLVVAPCSGHVTAMIPLNIGDSVAAGQIVAVVSPVPGISEQGSASPGTGQPWKQVLEEVSTLKNLAEARLAPASEEPGVVLLIHDFPSASG